MTRIRDEYLAATAAAPSAPSDDYKAGMVRMAEHWRQTIMDAPSLEALQDVAIKTGTADLADELGVEPVRQLKGFWTGPVFIGLSRRRKR